MHTGNFFLQESMVSDRIQKLLFYLGLTVAAILFSEGSSLGQGDVLKTQMAALESQIASVQSGSRQYEQKLTFQEPALVRYSYDEIDQKGNRTNYVYEFNLADLDPYAVREQTQKDLITVAVTVRNKRKLIKVYKNEAVQPYDGEVAIMAKDIDNGRSIADIIKKAIPAAEKVMASRLKLSGYDAMADWLVSHVTDVNLGEKTVRQSMARGEQPGTMTFTRVETGSKSSTEEVLTFNLADVNPNAVNYKISGNQFAIRVEALQEAKYFSVRRDGEVKPYVNDMLISTNNADEARDLKQVLTSVIPLAQEKVKAGMPAVSSEKDGLQKITALVTDISYGEKQTLQSLAGDCLATLTQVEKDAKASHESVRVFSWMDVNPAASKIDVSGEKLMLDLNFTDGNKLVMTTTDGKFEGYDKSVKLYMAGIENARSAKFVMDNIIGKCKAAYREPFGSDVATTLKYIRSNIREISLDDLTLQQKLEAVEGDDNKNKLTIREVKTKGTGSEHVYEFNLSDINPSSVSTAVKGKWLYVVFETEHQGKIIKYYKDGKIQPYANALELAVNDVTVARNLVSALTKAVKAVKGKP